MPLFRVKDKLHFYAHVPKCAGTSVEVYLTERFGPLAMLDKEYYAVAEPQRWNRTSPQHIDIAAFERLFPEDWIASSFAVVRHPVKRVISAFHFQKEVLRQMPAGMDINDWLLEWFESAGLDQFQHDNHLRRQAELVPAEAKIFHLEHGLDAVVAHLDGLAGDSNGPRTILPENTRKGEYSTESKLSEKSLTLIGEYYADDFARLGYVLDEKLPRKAAPKMAASGNETQGKTLWRKVKRRIVRKLGG